MKTRKRILYTQRVEVIESYQETRDCADRRIAEFLQVCGFLPVPVPNLPDVVRMMLRELQPDGAFLTGGNNLVAYGGISPERDAVDELLMEQALEQDFPVFGICRGMQSILHYFGVPLHEVQGHVAVQHRIAFSGRTCEVNSYHTLAAHADEVAWPLQVLGASEDGVAESVRHEECPLQGIMWHPERVQPFSTMDIEIVRSFFEQA